MAAVKPASDDSGDEELAAVSVRAGIGHGKKTRASVLDAEVLVREFRAVDRLAADAGVVSEVTALDHEVGNDTVEPRTRVTEAFLASGKSTEVLNGFRNDIAVKTEHDTTEVLSVLLDIEVDFVGDGLRNNTGDNAEKRDQFGEQHGVLSCGGG